VIESKEPFPTVRDLAALACHVYKIYELGEISIPFDVEEAKGWKCVGYLVYKDGYCGGASTISTKRIPTLS